MNDLGTIDLDTFRAGWAHATRDLAAAEALEREIAKLGSLGGEEPAWLTVRDRALALLSSAPDLVAAVQLAQALLTLDGLDGLALGLGLVRDLLREEWETLHPPLDRLRARRAALLWLAERAARALPPSAPAASVARCAAVVQEAYVACEQRFGEPLLGPLRRRLEALVAPAAPSGPTNVATPSRSAPQGSPDRAEALAHLAAAADYFQRHEPHSPVGPLLRRALAWSEAGFEEVFRELLARAPEARAALWETLGLKAEAKR